MTAWRVVLPLAAPGLGAAGAMVFISVVTELTTTLLLAPIGTRTLATQVWVDTSTLAFAAAAPYAALLVLISLASSWLLASFFGRSGVARLRLIGQDSSMQPSELNMSRSRSARRRCCVASISLSSPARLVGDPGPLGQRQDDAAAAALRLRARR